MTATEPIQGGPYPVPSDPPDGPNQMSALATWAAGRLVMRFASTTTRDTAIPVPTDGMLAMTGTGSNLRVWIGHGGAWVTIEEYLSGAWVAYTPTLVGVTLNNGTLTGAYRKLGREVRFRATLVLGSTSSVSGTIRIGLPAMASAAAIAAGLGGGSFMPIGSALLADASVGTSVRIAATTTMYQTGNECFINVAQVGSFTAPTTVNGTNPFTSATGDIYAVEGCYEAAA